MNVPSLHWGERTELLAKRTAYLFSLDIDYRMSSRAIGTVPGGILLPLRATPAREWSTYHVYDEELVTTVDGVVREVPRMKVITGSDRLVLDRNGIVNLDGRLLLQSEAGGSLSLEYAGVVKLPALPGGLGRVAAAEAAREAGKGNGNGNGNGNGEQGLRGTAFLATRHESQSTKYRWLVQNQLIGFGTAEVRPPASKERDDWQIELSVDLYSAG